MGREIKRVQLDFDWPLNKIWKGYDNELLKYVRSCPFCTGTGYNVATQELADGWYSFDRREAAWNDRLTQHEVDALLEADRLYDLTKRWVKGEGWIDTGHRPDADEVNAWQRSRHGCNHDGINRGICIQARAESLGVYGLCEHCRGEGSVWLTQGLKVRSELWEPTEPPTGDGYQIWENVSEGSPISPVFAFLGMLVEWLIEEGYSPDAARSFARVGYAPSMIAAGGALYKDIESCAHMGGTGDGWPG